MIDIYPEFLLGLYFPGSKMQQSFHFIFHAFLAHRIASTTFQG